MHAILVGHEVMPANLMTWARWFEATSRSPGKNGLPTGRHVAHDVVPGGKAKISTVFLGIDHSFNGGRPLWFETMVFVGGVDVDMARYATWDEAAAGHAAMLAKHSVNVWSGASQ